MSDLSIGLIIMTFLCVVLFRMGLRAGRFHSRLVISGLAVATVTFVLIYGVWLWDNPVLADLLPFSNLILLGNWFPLGAALLGGLIFDLLPTRRRPFMLGSLGVAAILCLIAPLLGSAPECGAMFDADGRCVQSTEATCSAACAVSLLNLHGIAATEQEMAELCLTRKGTRWQGLYRGLKTKTVGTPWDVEVVRCSTEELRHLPGQMILAVGASGTGAGAEELQAEFGWNPSLQHSVIRLSVDHIGNPLIYDPSPGYGEERWRSTTLQQLYRGHGLRLVPRTETPTVLSLLTR
jgi:hypothetical protein